MAWPWPTMMPDRIGYIGKTQGVSASRMPAPKKVVRISQKPAFFSRPASFEDSSSGAPPAASVGAAGAVLIAARLTCSVCGLGG
jgi:hypothetical protein